MLRVGSESGKALTRSGKVDSGIKDTKDRIEEVELKDGKSSFKSNKVNVEANAGKIKSVNILGPLSICNARTGLRNEV